MYPDMTAATIQSNQIVLNEVKDNYALLEPSYRKKQTTQYICWPFKNSTFIHTFEYTQTIPGRYSQG